MSHFFVKDFLRFSNKEIATSSEDSFRANRPPAMPPNAVCVARGECPEDASRADVSPAQG